jgi:hypothetical protein
MHFDPREVVPGAGLEPALPCGKGILSPLCLPIPPSGLVDELALSRGPLVCPQA